MQESLREQNVFPAPAGSEFAAPLWDYCANSHRHRPNLCPAQKIPCQIPCQQGIWHQADLAFTGRLTEFDLIGMAGTSPARHVRASAIGPAWRTPAGVYCDTFFANRRRIMALV